MRPLSKLDDIDVAEWTEAEAFAHLVATFDQVARQFPDLLEPYSILLGGDDPPQAKMGVMRRGLRETFTRRYPPVSPLLAPLLKAGLG